MASDLSLVHRRLSPTELTRLRFRFLFHLVRLHSIGQPTPVTGSVRHRCHLLGLELASADSSCWHAVLLSTSPTNT